MKRKLISVGLILSCMIASPASPQPIGPGDEIIYYGEQLPTYTCISFSSRSAKRKFLRRSKMVLKVYPYARIAGNRLQICENELAAMTAEERKINAKKYYRIVEKEIKEEFYNDMKRLSAREGQILIKLIDRECNRTGYTLIKDLRNGLVAWGYQQFAKICGTNLKKKYDPIGEDEDIEFILEYNNLI